MSVRRLRLLALIALLAPLARAHATPADAQAEELFTRGRAAYQSEQYQRAYDDFRQAYLLSPRPPLIYNMARALEGLKRYAEAADQLKSYLRVSPSTPDRAEIEEHIRALEEAQRMQSNAALSHTLSHAPLREPDPPPRHHLGLAIGLAVAGVVLAGLAVGLGVGFGTQGPSYSSADVGPLKSTP